MSERLKLILRSQVDDIIQKLVVVMQRSAKNHSKIKRLRDKQKKIETKQSQMSKRLRQLVEVLNAPDTIVAYNKYRNDRLQENVTKSATTHPFE